MTITSLFTDGWLSEPLEIDPPVIVIQSVFTGTLDDGGALTGSLSDDDFFSGTLADEEPLVGLVVSENLVGVLTAESPFIGTIRCDGEIILADITMPRGDSRSFLMSILQSDGVNPVDLTGAILRFAVKERYGQANNASKIFKTTYLQTDIEITNATEGESVVHLRIDDTIDVEPGRYVWELELTRKSNLVTSAGRLSFTQGSDVASASNVNFSLLKIGQYVEPAGSMSGNNVPVLITALDESNGTIKFEGYDYFSTESEVTFNAYQGDRKTPNGLSGHFVLEPDVVR